MKQSDDTRIGTASGRRVLILNQHGDNRGDEAAFRAMFAAIEECVDGAVRFTVLHQFRGGKVNLRIPQEVDWISLVPSLLEAARISLFALFLAIGIEWRALLGRWGRSVVDACKSCEIAISAPGGPYFGDLYPLQEPVHWFYVWLAGKYRKPLLLYAPSVGPFRNGLLNMLRRIMFRRFSRIAVREQVSLEYLMQLLGNRHPPVVLAADSALQRPLSPYRRSEYFTSPIEGLSGRLLVGVSALEWTFPRADNRREAQTHYEEVLMQSLVYLHEKYGAHFLFVPQLYGNHHTDVPFLQRLAARLPADASWELVDPDADSDHQQRVFGMVDVCVASRYHPMVFALNHAVPAVALYYQHKALGILRHFGLERFGIPIDRVSMDACRVALDEAIERREEISAQIKERLPHVQAIAARSTDLVVELMTRGDRVRHRH